MSRRTPGRSERCGWGNECTGLTCYTEGIRQAYPLYERAPEHLSWPRQALRGLTYLETGKGPQRQWLREIGKTDDASCVCDGWTPQNVTHLYVCPWVGDGVGRSREQAREDAVWCAVMARFVV